MNHYFCGGYEFPRESSAVQYGDLMGLEVLRETRREDEDPVLGHGISRYVAGGWEWLSNFPPSRPIAVDPENNAEPPKCSPDCRYRQSFSQFRQQRNALRSELASLIATDRCGWNIKEGHLGGDPLDYYPCTFQGRVAAQ